MKKKKKEQKKQHVVKKTELVKRNVFFHQEIYVANRWKLSIEVFFR